MIPNLIKKNHDCVFLIIEIFRVVKYHFSWNLFGNIRGM